MQSQEPSLDVEGHCHHHDDTFACSPSMQPMASGCVHTENRAAAYFVWPTPNLQHCAAEGRANYFGNLQKGLLPVLPGRLPKGQQANSLLDLMTIRAFHSRILWRLSLGMAVGFRIKKGDLTDIPSIIAFVSRKVHKKWLNPDQCLPAILVGPGGVWCDVDVVEFSYYGAPAPTPKEQMYSELVNKLCGSDEYIGSGSQVASQDTFGTFSAIVKRRTSNKQVGFLTNRHVAVDLDYPNQKLFHPWPPNCGPGIYLGAVERATSFVTDDAWYGIYAGTNPVYLQRHLYKLVVHSFHLLMTTTFPVTTIVREVGEIGDVKVIDLQCPISSLVGKQVCKVGRSSGHTTGTLLAYALECNDEKGTCFFTDLLVVGENRQTFDLEGDSGSLIILTSQDEEKPRPIGIIWGGTEHSGRMKLTGDHGHENWTTGVDLGRLLDRLELDLILTNESLNDAVQEQRNAFVSAVICAVGESSMVGVTAPEATPEEKGEEIFESLGIKIQQLPRHDMTSSATEGEGAASALMEEHQFMSNFVGVPAMRRDQDAPRSITNLNDPSEEELAMSLQHLGDREPKRLRLDPESNLDLEKRPWPDPESSLDLENRPCSDPEASLDLEKRPHSDLEK